MQIILRLLQQELQIQVEELELHNQPAIQLHKQQIQVSVQIL